MSGLWARIQNEDIMLITQQKNSKTIEFIKAEDSILKNYRLPHTKLIMSSKSAPPPLTLTTEQLLKMAAPIVLFSILLPAVDNVTDLIMITRLYTGITGCAAYGDLPWQERYTCQEDPATYCQSNPNSDQCYYFEQYGWVSDIPGCKEIWQNKYICQEDPVIYCQSNPNSTECYLFKSRGWAHWGPSDIPGCVSCETDTATFCEKRPNSPRCVHIKHTRFATMFLGKY